MSQRHLYAQFLLSTAIFAYVPGPAMLYTAAQTIARGQRAGLTAALGIHLGGYVHVGAAAVGLTFLLSSVPGVYEALKFLGSLYLIWLGLKLASAASPSDCIPGKSFESGRNAFRESVVVELLNPKTAVFYLAFLPQFTDVNLAFSIEAQILLLGVVVNIMFSSADVACVFLAGKVPALTGGSSSSLRIGRILGGALIIGLGLNLAVSHQ